MRSLFNSNSEINLILPHYTDSGDQTKICAIDHTSTLLPLKVKTVIRKLANRQAVDLCRLKSTATGLTKAALWQPLVLAPDLVLVPLKVRKPRVNGDSTGGYFNFFQIKSVHPSAGHTIVQCKNGEEIHVLWKQNTVNDHLQRAHLAMLAQGSQALLIERFTQFVTMITLSGMQRIL